jgi:hypothetical protein
MKCLCFMESKVCCLCRLKNSSLNNKGMFFFDTADDEPKYTQQTPRNSFFEKLLTYYLTLSGSHATGASDCLFRLINVKKEDEFMFSLPNATILKYQEVNSLYFVWDVLLEIRNNNKTGFSKKIC